MARYDYDAGFQNRRSAGRTPRVTARYNRDYTEHNPDYGYRRNFEDFTDDEGPIVGADAYVRPYATIGGTITGRGRNQPIGWEQGRGRTGDEEGHGSSRPRVGGYRAGYQGGTGGIEVDTTGPIRRGYDRDFRERGYDREFRARGYDADLARRRQYLRSGYDRDFRDRPENFRPRFSPVGGMDAGMGGEYSRQGEPRPFRESRPTSEWTRWF